MSIMLHHHSKTSSTVMPFLLHDNGEDIEQAQKFLHDLWICGMSPATLRAYAYDLLAFYRFLDSSCISIADLTSANLTSDHALKFVIGLKKSNIAPRTINRRIASIRSFLNSLSTNWGNEVFAAPRRAFYKGQRNRALLGPARTKSSNSGTLRVKVPSTLKLPLQAETVHSFINQLRSLRDRAIVALMLCLGLRSCEIINLKTHDIDLDASQIRVWGKGDKERLLPMSPWIKSSIANYLAFERPSVAHSACFVVLKGKRRGEHMLPEGLRKIFRHRRAKNTSLKDAHPHRFRHTFCTNLIRQKVPLPIVQKLMGHASIDTTLIYINLSMEDVAEEYHRAMDELAKIDANEKT